MTAEQHEKCRLVALEDLIESDPDWKTRWSPGSAGFHELCDRSMILVNQVYELLVEHPACFTDPELYTLAFEAFETLRQLNQAASLQCAEKEQPVCRNTRYVWRIIET